MMRALVGQVVQESNSFIEQPTDLSAFEGKVLVWGDAMLGAFTGTGFTMAGFLDGLAGVEGLHLVPTVAGWAPSGGRLTTQCFETLVRPIAEAATPELDGVLLALHGAMMTEEHDDAEGALLARVRDRVGPDVPIIATFDLHANITPAMVEHADGLIGFDTYPHVDLYEVGVRAAEMLRRSRERGTKPRTVLAKVPMIVPAEGMATAEEPMRSLLARAFDLRERDGVLSTSVAAVQPWLDVPDTGFSVIAVLEGPERTDEVLDELRDIALEAWERRDEFDAPLVPVDEAIDRALASPEGPVVLSDSADATGAGSAGDSALLTERLLARRPERQCIACIVAPEAVAAAIEAGIGARIVTRVGAQVDPRWTQPVEIEAEVRLLSSGHFRYRGGKAKGLEVSMGRAAVLKCGNVHIVVMERPAETGDPGLYESVGLPPERAAVVLVRSANQFRDSYRDIATDMMIVDALGPSTARLDRLPWKRVNRPIHPLDDLDTVAVRTTIPIR